MGKNKRQKLSTPQHKKPPNQKTKGLKPPSKPKSAPKPQPPAKTGQAPRTPRPIIPFRPADNILLIGEGDLSFSRSLLTHHGCKSLTCTVLEPSLSFLIEKYPQAAENIAVIEEGGGKIRYGVDVSAKMHALRKECVVKGRGVVDRVVFNFPHVGGKSKDVNRQVRYNQEMLVQFFTTTIPLLSPTRGSSIIVTLFEGEPYTLWNIRDLARHSGLEVLRSFRFRGDAYPGYRHARTLGVVKGKKGNGEVSEKAWKGEERAARSYVFVRKGEGEEIGPGKGKRKRGDDSESESDIESEGEDEDAGGNDDDGVEGGDGDEDGHGVGDIHDDHDEVDSPS